MITDHAWRDGMQRVNDESGGLLNVDIIDSRYGAELLAHAMLGDSEALALLKAVAQAGARVKGAPRRTPALCIACPRAVKRISCDTVFGVATPAIPSPTGAVGFVFCEKCAADRVALATKAADGLRRIWPDLRPVQITHESGGRA